MSQVRINIAPESVRTVSARETGVVVEVVAPEIRPVEVITPGPQGAKGAPGDPGNNLGLRAAVPISGHRFVTTDSAGRLICADYREADQAGRVIGMTTGAIEADSEGLVRTAGEVSDPSISLIRDMPVFLGEAGAYTQTPPDDGWLLGVGFAVASDTIYIRVGSPIRR